MGSDRLLQVIISAGRPDVGLALSPDGMMRAVSAQVGNLCKDEQPRSRPVTLPQPAAVRYGWAG